MARTISCFSVDALDLSTIGSLAVGAWVEISMELNWEQIQDRVCRKCIDGDTRGGCRLPVDQMCSLKEFFSEIVRTVTSIHSESLQDYVDALRSHICRTCEHQYANGTCRKRDVLECALDRYFPIVVDIIESAKVPDMGMGHGPA